MSTVDAKARFLEAVAASMADESFVRIVLGKYRGPEEIERTVVTPVALRGGVQYKFVTRRRRQDVTQNYAADAAVTEIGFLVGETFLSVTLFTTQKDVSLQFSKKREARLTEGKATYHERTVQTHDRSKARLVEPGAQYLKALGVSDGKGTVKPSMFGKFKQISHFVEIIDDLIRDSELKDAAALRVTDIGSGKGYLTFALYDFLTRRLEKDADVLGVEVRADLVALCNGVAAEAGFSGLSFAAQAAADDAQRRADMLIALHACDTATDDAIYAGISSEAAMIITAPCCQHELAPQIAADGDLKGLMKFGLFKQRAADLITDAARALLLEASGYKVKVIEFVSTEHTAKNLLLAAIRSERVDRETALREYKALKALAGFKTQHLEAKLFAGGALN